MSIICTLYYLICAEQADEKVRKVRSVLTVDHLRVSWNKALSPWLSLFTRIQRPRFTKYQPRAIRIPRPTTSSYTEPVHGWLYFDGPVSSLKRQRKVVLNIPGGGFVAMSPRTHDDSLLAWAGKTGLPILSLDYRKAPEFPYPYALNECYDVYSTIIHSKGRCLGLSGSVEPRIVISGDSAGGNLAASVTLMILQSGSTDTRKWLGQNDLPPPTGLILIYPALDMNIGNWMTDEQMSLIRDRRMRNTNRRVMRHKSNDFRKVAPSTPLPSDDEDSDSTLQPKQQSKMPVLIKDTSLKAQQPLKSRLAVPSLISYVSDRVLTPEMMRAMIILYVGPHNRPDFTTEYFLSPVLAPEALLAQFPKTHFLTGERDPLVDDTVIMAGRIRAAKASAFQERKEVDLLTPSEKRRGFVERDHVDVTLVEGISHGFIQFGSIFPEAWGYIYKIGRWFEECFDAADRRVAREIREQQSRGSKTANDDRIHHKRTLTGQSSDDDEPLEMSMRLTRMSPEPCQHQSASNANGLSLSKTNSFEDSVPPTPYTPGAHSPELLSREHPLGRRGSSAPSRSKSLASLASEDDLLGRRMKGLVGGLTNVKTPE